MTAGYIADWILENRTGKVFKGWTKDQLVVAIANAVNDATFVVDTSELGEIQGVVIAERNDDYKLLHIQNILCKKPGVLKRFALKFKQLYPSWDIQAYRKNENIVRYDTRKLIQKLIK